MKAKQYMDAGDLVPDEVTIAMVRDRLAEDDASDGFLLDGFPRNVPQAESWTRCSPSRARSSTSCSSSWSTTTRSSGGCLAGEPAATAGTSGTSTSTRRSSEGICDDCGGQLFQRDDDKAETVRHRLEVYAEQTSPLIAFYADAGHAGRHRRDRSGRRRDRARDRRAPAPGEMTRGARSAAAGAVHAST